MDSLEKLIARFVRFSLSFPKATLALALLVTALSAYMTGLIKIRTNFSDLLPNDNPAVLQAKELEKIVGGASFVVVAVEAGKTPAANAAAGTFLDDLKAKLLASPALGIRYIDDRPPTDFLKKASLLYLSSQDLDRLHDKIKLRIDQAKLRKMKLLIDFDAPGGFEQEIDEFKSKYATYVTPTSHYQNKDGTLLASLIKPDWRTTELSRTQDLVGVLNKTIDELNPKRYDPSLNVRLTGPYIKQLHQKDILLRDATVVSTISFIGSILYLILHFRRKRAVFLIGVPLTVSTVWAMGLAYLLFGSLNLFSSASCAILMGLGAEFGIHFYTEYLHERRLGRETADALFVSMSRLGRAFLAASSTTAAAFFALAFTRFKALHELGVISGTGILLCGVAFVFMLPPLTLIMERWSPDKKLPKIDWEEKKQSFSRSSIRWIFSRTNLIATGLIFLLTLLSVPLGYLRFDYNLNHVMGSQDTKELDGKIDGIFNHSVNPEVALAQSFEDAGKVAGAIRSVQEKNAATPQGTTIKGALSLSDFIPSDQAAKREKITGIKALFTPTVLKFMKDDDRKSYDQLKPMLDPPEVTLQVLPEQITNKFTDKTGSVGKLAFIFPNFDPSQADKFMRFVDEIREVRCPDCSGAFYASGESTVFYEIVKLLSLEGRYVIGFTVLMILGALWINFRSVSAMALVFAPLVLGIAGTLGVMGLIGLPFNIINVAAIPIIIGTTDDYGVHLYQRINDNPEASLQDSYRMTFRPIIGSAVSALIGFGSLGFAQMGGIRSFGIVCVVGITLCTAATLFWFPALLALRQTRRVKLKALVLALLLLLTPSLAWSYSTTNVPIDDPVYHDIDRLVGLGLARDVIYGQRPWSRGEIARIIAGAAKKHSDEGPIIAPDERDLSLRIETEDLLERLQKEYREELIELGAADGERKTFSFHPLAYAQAEYNFLDSEARSMPNNGLGFIDALVEPLAAYREGRRYPDGHQLALETEHRLRATRFFSFYLRPRFQLDVTHGGNISAHPYVQQLYLKFAVPHFELLVGRDSIEWGQGEYGGILLSNNARPLDMIKISNPSPTFLPWVFRYLGPFRYTFFVANLGPEREFPYSFLTGAKFSIKPTSFLELGIDQLLMLGGDGAPGPLTPGNVLQEFFGMRVGDVNAVNLTNREMGFDMRLTFSGLRNSQLYLDAQIEDFSSVLFMMLHTTSYQAGFYIPRLSNDGRFSLRLEYRHGSPYFSRHAPFTTGMALNRRILGDELGPQADGGYAQLYFDPNQNTSFKFGVAYERRDGDVLTQTFKPNGDRDTIVTSVPVPAEERIRWGVSVAHHLSKRVRLSSDFSHEFIHNYNFSSGDNKNGFLLGASVRFDLF